MPDLTFLHYYQTELAYYRELAHEFAAAYPEVAHLVSERGGDPAADRLFQGSALLTSRLKYRIDDDVPEIVHALFGQLWPYYVRPKPSVTLIQFSPLPNALQQSQLVPQGATLKSRTLANELTAGGTEKYCCNFKTCTNVMLHPLEIARVELKRPHPADLQLHFRFRLTGGTLFDNVKIHTLRLQLTGDDQTKFTLFLWLAHHAQKITVKHPNGAICLTLPRHSIRPAGLANNEPLYPSLSDSLRGMRLLQEYFLFADKFLAIDVTGLDRVLPRSIKDVFDLIFHLGPLTENTIPISADNFRLGCTPAINLSEGTKVEMRVEPGIKLIKIEAPYQGEVFQVERVGCYLREASNWFELRELFSLGGSKSSNGGSLCYQVVRRLDGIKTVGTYLAITDEKANPAPLPADHLQLWLTYTDGDKPRELKMGEINVPTSTTPAFATFTNITPVAQSSDFETRKNFLWQLLAQIIMHPVELVSHNGLQVLLSTASADVRPATLPEILEINSSMTTLLHEQTPFPVRKIEITIDENSFSCLGECYLFSAILRNLFTRQANTFGFHQLTVKAVPSGTCFAFDPQ